MLLRDLSNHGVLRVEGVDRVRFLNGMLTNDVARLGHGQGQHAAMLTVKGKLLGDLLVFCEPDALVLDVAPAARERVRAAFERHIIVDDVTIEERGAALGLLGEGAANAIEERLGAVPETDYAHRRHGELLVARVPDLGLGGVRVYGDVAALRAALQAGGVELLADEAAEALRIAAGQPRYGVDMAEDHLPQEARLDDAVSSTKGCYLGQEVIARLLARGHINKRLSGLLVEGATPAEPGSRLSAPGRDDAGVVTSSALHPRHGSIALAYVHRSSWAPGTVLTLHGSGGPRTARVADLPLPAQG